MQYLDLSFPTPEENIACDEALLQMCEEGYDYEILRFWEPDNYFVVLGRSDEIDSNANVKVCRENNVSILRRSSGGGTVLQGPGCLNYSVILKINPKGPTRNITTTNAFVLEKNIEALQPLIQPRSVGAGSPGPGGETPPLQHTIKITRQGKTDLTLGNLKFSGNAQARKKRYILFHGTFLLDFSIPLIEKYLPIPTRQPLYRHGRRHEEFLINLHLENGDIKKCLKSTWGAQKKYEMELTSKIQGILKIKYQNLNS